MRAADLEVGKHYLVKLPYEAGEGIGQLLDTKAEPVHEDRPYPGKGKTNVRVAWVAQCDGAAIVGQTMCVMPRNVIREAEPGEIPDAELSGTADRPPPVSGEEGGGVDRAPVSGPAQPGPPPDPAQPMLQLPPADVVPGQPPPLVNLPTPPAPEQPVEGAIEGELLEPAPRQEDAPEEIRQAAAGLTTADVTQADEFKPDAQDLVVPQGLSQQETRAEVVRVMDRADELMILDELQGRILEVYMYSFEQDGKRLTDLSVAGVGEAVRLLNDRAGRGIRVSPQPPQIEYFEESGKKYVRVMVYAEDTVSNAGRWGVAVEPTHMRYTIRKGPKRGEKGTKWDKFALTKAVNKAQRNALKSMVPEDLRQMMISVYLGDENRVRRLTRGVPTDPGQKEELPAPLTDEKAKAQEHRLRELYNELKEINPMAMGPGAFNQYLRHAAHSHARMDDFMEHLQELIVKEREKQNAAEQERRAQLEGQQQ